MRVADFVFQFFANRGIRNVFLVTGGAAMHLNDALGRETRIKSICTHHEQAAAIAAECHARITGLPGVVSITGGPGGINALNGVFGAFTDSVPMIVISGQVKRETLIATHGLEGKIRQLGDQEVDIVSMARGITKYAHTLLDPAHVRLHLEMAWHIATTGRPGPCWIDIPVDVQGSRIDPDTLPGFTPQDACGNAADLPAACAEILNKVAAAERPVILAGSGIRIARANDLLVRIADRLGIPITTAWAHDIIPSSHPCFCGRPGSIGDRAGNFVVQNSDLLLILGSRLNIRQVSYNWDQFARNAYKIQVDIDPAEMSKPTVRPDWAVCHDLCAFLTELERQLPDWKTSQIHREWLSWSRERLARYPAFVPERHASHGRLINPYHFASTLFRLLAERDIVVCGDATATIVTFQCADIKPGQRLISNSGCASMGYDLPAAIGAAAAAPGRRIICMAGDGSLQMNIQELQTLAHHRWPIKLFVLNNGGYLSIRQTQSNFFGLEFGATPKSGVSFPDPVRVAGAYGLPATRLEGPDFEAGLAGVLEADGPLVCEVMLDPGQAFEPKLSSRRLEDGRMVTAPLEDMAPFLDREEFASNMRPPGSKP